MHFSDTDIAAQAHDHPHVRVDVDYPFVYSKYFGITVAAKIQRNTIHGILFAVGFSL